MRFKITLVSFVLLASMTKSYAAEKTSVVNGNWSDPATWSPVGVPMMEDTVIINTNVTATGIVDVGIDYLIINEGFTLSSDFAFGLHGNLINNGTVGVAEFAIGDGQFSENEGTINATILGTGNSEYFKNNGIINATTMATSEPLLENYGTINVQDLTTSELVENHFAIFCDNLFTNTAKFNNHTGAALVATTLITEGDLTNDGDITCTTWTVNEVTVDGTDGKFCVAGCFINSGSIEGSIDICDASPDGICDLNMGTIAGTVTNCVGSPCIDNLSVEDELALSLNVYPNPTNGTLYIDLSLSENETTIQICSLNGQVIYSTNQHTKSVYAIELSDLSSGVYICKVQNQKMNWQQLIVVN